MLTQILTAVSITLSILGAMLAVSTLVVRYHSSERPDDDETDEEADECDGAICEKLEAILLTQIDQCQERIKALEHENSQLRLENENLETELGKYKKDQRPHRRNDSPEI